MADNVADVSASVPSGPRRGAARLAAFLFAMALLLIPGLGLVDLVSGVMDVVGQGELGILRMGYGLLIGLLLPVAFFSIARDPERAAAPLQQVFAAALAFAVAALSGAVLVGLVGSAVLLVLGAAVFAVLPQRRNVLHFSCRRIARPLASVAGLGALPWLVYALAMAADQRRDALPYEDFTLGLQGWSGLCAFAIALVLFALVAALRPDGWRTTVWSTGLAAVGFGFCGVISAHLPGGPGRWWAAAAMAWGVALIVAGARAARRDATMIRES